MQLLSYRHELDGLRAIAALMVMFFHFFELFAKVGSYPSIVHTIASLGASGVSLFFVLSGFLITRILINSRGSEHYFRQFYMRRTLRIFPLYFLFLSIYYFLLPLVFNQPTVGARQQLAFWVYLQDFAVTFNWNSIGPSHYWTLAIEEHFYLFWPLLVFFLNNEKLQTAIGVIIFAALFTRILLVLNGNVVYYFTFTRMDELAIGAFLAILEQKQKFSRELSGSFARWGLSVLLVAGGLWYIYDGQDHPVIQVVKYLFFGALYFSVIGWVICLPDNHWVKKGLQSTPLRFSGRISYGLYIYHLACFELIRTFLDSGNTWINLATSIMATFLVAAISYYAFEKKFLDLKRYFNYRPAPRIA